MSDIKLFRTTGGTAERLEGHFAELEAGFSRDVRQIGHFGTGDLELRLTTLDDVEKAKGLIVLSYEAS